MVGEPPSPLGVGPVGRLRPRGPRVLPLPSSPRQRAQSRRSLRLARPRVLVEPVIAGCVPLRLRRGVRPPSVSPSHHRPLSHPPAPASRVDRRGAGTGCQMSLPRRVVPPGVPVATTGPSPPLSPHTVQAPALGAVVDGSLCSAPPPTSLVTVLETPQKVSETLSIPVGPGVTGDQTTGVPPPTSHAGPRKTIVTGETHCHQGEGPEREQGTKETQNITMSPQGPRSARDGSGRMSRLFPRLRRPGLAGTQTAARTVARTRTQESPRSRSSVPTPPETWTKDNRPPRTAPALDPSPNRGARGRAPTAADPPAPTDPAVRERAPERRQGRPTTTLFRPVALWRWATCRARRSRKHGVSAGRFRPPARTSEGPSSDTQF